MNIKNLALAVSSVLLLSSAAVVNAQSINIGSASVPTAGGGAAAVPVSFDPEGVDVGAYNTVFSYDSTILDGDPTSSTARCVVDPGTATISVARFSADALPLPAEELCVVTFDVTAGTAVGVYPLAHDPSPVSTAFADLTNAPLTGTVNDGEINVVAEGPPTLTFDTTPVALPAGPYGSTQTGTIPANFTPSTGDYSVDFSCVAPAGFTVAPTSGTYDNTDTAADDLTVSATLTDVAQSGDVVCTVTPEGGSATTFTIPVSAPAGAETAPVLDPTPASGGTVTVGGGAPGSNGTGTLVVTPDGGAGTDVAEVECTASAPVSISPASLTFPVGSSPQNFTVTVPLTDAAQSFPGAISCWGEDGNGPFEWTFDVSAPAGVAAPTFIPATSLWSKFALIGVFAALGLLMVGLRRNH